MKIKDIVGNSTEVTDLKKAIRQCKLCQNSPFIIDSGHTIGENYSFMLQQLEELKNELTSFLGEPDAKQKKQKTENKTTFA